MKLARVGAVGTERPVVLVDDGGALDARPVTADFDRAFFESDGLARLAAAVATGGLEGTEIAGERIGPPVARPGNVVAIGLNYAKHAAESGQPIPVEPIVFLKPTNTVVGAYDDVVIPRGSTSTDWEVELAVVIGRRAAYVDDPAVALEHVAGCAVCNDVSERDFQFDRGGGQWTKGKSSATFTPLGPWLVTLDEVGDVGGLDLWLAVNGEVRQASTTADMIFGVAELICHVSQFMVLDPGDVITTGTPSGVALGLPANPYLRDGDVIELSISSLGRQRQAVRAFT